ncbi:unnamed protein product [Bathycoccus prasinos]
MLLSYAKKKTKAKINPLVWLQLLLAVLSTKSVLQDVAEDRPFVVSSKAALVELFFFPESNGGVRVSNTKRNVAFVYDSNALIRSIESTVERYFHLPELALNELELIEKDGIEGLLPGNEINVDEYEESYRITSKTSAKEWKKRILGIDDTDVDGAQTAKRDFLRSLLSLELKFQARSLHREMDKLVLFDFDVSVNYSLESRGGRVQIEIIIGGNHVGGESFKSVETVFEDCFLLSLIAFTQVAVLRSTFNAKKKTDGDGGYARVRFPRRMRSLVSQSLFNRSIALETCANLVLFVGCLASISWQVLPQEGFGLGRNFARGLNGFGCFLIWASLGRHMTNLPPYDVAFRAISRGLPVVLQFAVGSAPLLMGFTTLGVALFAEETEKFKNLENGFLTLFSVMNGDIIFESARDMKRGIIGHVYIIIFVVIFVYTIISTFVSIMQKAFAEIESEKRRHEESSIHHVDVNDDNENNTRERRKTNAEEETTTFRRELSAIKDALASLERSILIAR